ncbi:Stp1/IreP family PP2C-type Ser/Thr phosphatase [Phormidium sp. LEGE 05292]|uniref:Stp1/IreP family PP2C-type Ser/Thr phosphatase n=1 Tax=[Phormidium] sp. LEGE 05292 TaxID=767427 RepID=UPI0018814C72|nr:Stp1/IreP family PP2C-type Ser/Thr phosphatase [Phormidium sp. LEGE 05292]MBE9228493.1 Stp1/IreP family PP2C-type Ser/Thr phosphatase [Phormidium sp. LEGE 05292]
MKSSFEGVSDPGLVRQVNQDAYYIDPQGRFFIVADGMGGHAGGQEASWIATKTIQSYLDEYWNSEDDSVKLLKAAFFKANQAILQDQREHPERSDMGTTAVVLVFREQRPWVAHVGDSRLYRLRGSKLEQITEDHTWVAKAMKAGDLTPRQAKTHPWRHMLSQCLGREDLAQVEIHLLDVKKDDRLLLCSDGLTEEVSESAIAKLLDYPLCDKAATALVEAAKENGGRDNITVIIVAIEDSLGQES